MSPVALISGFRAEAFRCLPTKSVRGGGSAAVSPRAGSGVGDGAAFPGRRGGRRPDRCPGRPCCGGTGSGRGGRWRRRASPRSGRRTVSDPARGAEWKRSDCSVRASPLRLGAAMAGPAGRCRFDRIELPVRASERRPTESAVALAPGAASGARAASQPRAGEQTPCGHGRCIRISKSARSARPGWARGRSADSERGEGLGDWWCGGWRYAAPVVGRGNGKVAEALPHPPTSRRDGRAGREDGGLAEGAGRLVVDRRRQRLARRADDRVGPGLGDGDGMVRASGPAQNDGKGQDQQPETTAERHRAKGGDVGAGLRARVAHGLVRYLVEHGACNRARRPPRSGPEHTTPLAAHPSADELVEAPRLCPGTGRQLGERNPPGGRTSRCRRTPPWGTLGWTADVELAHHGPAGKLDGMEDGVGDVFRAEDALGLGGGSSGWSRSIPVSTDPGQR